MAEEADPILEVIGYDLVSRFNSGEIGVFAAVDTQIAILDAALLRKKSHGDEPKLLPLLQMFQESKVPRVRAHKLERLTEERMNGVKPARKSNSPVVVASSPPQQPNKPPLADSTPPKRKLEQVQVEPTNERTIYILRNNSACVRVRSEPNVEFGIPLDLVDFNNNLIDVAGIAEDWFQVRLRNGDVGWVIRRGGGEDLFAPLPNDQEVVEVEEEELVELVQHQPQQPQLPQKQQQQQLPQASTTITVDIEAFNQLVLRVYQLEHELQDLKNKLRAI